MRETIASPRVAIIGLTGEPGYRPRTPPTSYSPERVTAVLTYRTGVVEPEVVVVPAGDALLGEPPRTQHVNVFAIARLPVTVAEYAQFLEENKHAPPSDWNGQRGHADEPVQGVSWADAVAYCRALTVGTGRIYRLPDEREWEKAALGGTLSGPRTLKEWTNSWLDGGRVVRSAVEPAVRLFARDDLRGVGFRLVRGMTGR